MFDSYRSPRSWDHVRMRQQSWEAMAHQVGELAHDPPPRVVPPMATFFGVRVVVDETMPANVIRVVAEDGAVLAQYRINGPDLLPIPGEWIDYITPGGLHATATKRRKANPVEAIDDALAELVCVQCGRKLGRRCASESFCSEICQRNWTINNQVDPKDYRKVQEFELGHELTPYPQEAIIESQSFQGALPPYSQEPSVVDGYDPPDLTVEEIVNEARAHFGASSISEDARRQVLVAVARAYGMPPSLILRDQT